VEWIGSGGANLFNILSGAASIAGLIAAVYSYLQQKKVEQVAKGFYQAIENQVNALEQEIQGAFSVQNKDYFDVLRAKVEAALSSARALQKNMRHIDTLYGHSRVSHYMCWRR
jgi:hypothetical protein